MVVTGLIRVAASRCSYPLLFRFPSLKSPLSPKSCSLDFCSSLRPNVLIYGLHSHSRLLSTKSPSSTEDVQGFEDLDKPIKYTTSKASAWTAERTFGGTGQRDTPEIQMYSIIFSVSVFLLYFCVFREENDLDEELGKPLWERIPGLEKKQLRVVYDYNEEHGIDNTAILKRMKEVELKEEEDAKKQQLLVSKAIRDVKEKAK